MENSKKRNSKMSPEQQAKFDTLTNTEKKYFRIMNSKYGVLYITSRPGVAKSAIAKSIADKMGYQYIDIRTSMHDETDMGLFPYLNTIAYEDDNKNTVNIKTMSFAIPEWAVVSNQRPTLIVFDELNRASLPVRNASLQILLERAIGSNFKFNDNVLMMACGNLGEEDDTDVEEFDSALNNRLIHISHDLDADTWINDFAKENVHPSIVGFIKVKGTYLYKKESSDEKAYATPRSWTMLSEYIITNYGWDSTPNDFLHDIREIGMGFVGDSIGSFTKFCEDFYKINITHVLNDYKGIKERLYKDYSRDKRTELINDLSEMELMNLSDSQLHNVTMFVKDLPDEDRFAYLSIFLKSKVNTNPHNTNSKIDDRISKFMMQFKDDIKSMKIVLK